MNIPLLQAIKEIPIYNSLIKKSCIKKPGRRKKYPPTMNVIEKLVDLILARVLNPKYLDLGRLIVNVHINEKPIPKTIIDIGESTNVMTRDTMLKLNIQNSLSHATIVLQLVNRSIITPKGILEDIIVSIDS